MTGLMSVVGGERELQLYAVCFAICSYILLKSYILVSSFRRVQQHNLSHRNDQTLCVLVSHLQM